MALIREDRDAAFWTSIYEHPAVKPHVSLGHDLDMGAIVASPLVTPFRAEHGGFLFVQIDGLGRVVELHSMFAPEGWGREVLQSLKESVAAIFARGVSLIVTHEVAGNWRSQPPRTFRFAEAGGFGFSPDLNAEIRTWVLTQQAWEGSPARKRMASCL